MKSFKNEIHFECSPFFSNFFGPSPVSLDVDGLTASSPHTFLYSVFFVFAIFSGENFCRTVHMYLQRMAQNTFLACKLIVHTLSLKVSLRIFDKKRRMAMSKEEMAKHYDYQMKDKVVLEEEASWAKLCSKLVSIYIKNHKKIVKKS